MLLGLMLYLVFWGRMLRVRDVISLGRAACRELRFIYSLT
jgi:hypothetical protein